METRDGIIYYDLSTRDGRLAVEVRVVAVLGDGALYVSPRRTVYACAFNSQAGRIAAFSRAVSFCNEALIRILSFENSLGRRATWI